MVINKILNNNAVITRNEKKQEIVVMGKGIAYGKKVGDSIESSKIIKVFLSSESGERKRIIDMISQIPLEQLEIAKAGFDLTRTKYKIEVNDSLYIALADHINTSIERYQEGIKVNNTLLAEIKSFYRSEFEIGMFMLDLIEEVYGIKMKEDEAAFLALHIVSCEAGNEMAKTYAITSFIQLMLDIVQEYFSVSLDVDSLAYSRFITHLKYFGLRILNGKKASDDNEENELLDLVKNKYIDAYLCASKMAGVIQDSYGYLLSNDELLYLTIHITKVIGKQ